MNLLTSTLAACIIASVAMSAQENHLPTPPSPQSGVAFGLASDVTFNLHTAGFAALPGYANCCPEFSSGFGIAPSVDFIVDLPLTQKLLLSLRGGYARSDATLREGEVTTVEQKGQGVQTTIDHVIDASLADLGIGALVGYRLTNRLTVATGIRSGAVVTSDFAQKEQLADESTSGTFENGQRVRHEYAGAIPGALPVTGSFLVGGSYSIPLNSSGTLTASPEVYISIGLLPVSSDVSWNGHAVRAGLAIKYAPPSSAEPPVLIPAEPVLPPEPERTRIIASVDASGLAPDGTEEPSVRLRIEEFTATDMQPLLGYIFFDRESAQIPSRYLSLSSEQISNFSAAHLQQDEPLTVSMNTLNILGERLQQDPSASITLTGTTDDTGPEHGNIELAQRRSEAVRDYLTNNWGIERGRIRIERRNLPSHPSNNNDLVGQEENRRVEITSSNSELLRPVVLSDTLRHASPPALRFRTEVTADAGVASWRLDALQNGDLLRTFEGNGDVPEKIDWQVDVEQGAMPHAPGKLIYSLTVVDRNGAAFTTPPEAIDVEQITLQKKRTERIADAEIERYGLILFDFDRADLRPDHLSVIREIRSRIDPEATIIVRGYTDRTGDAERNQQLALQRANAVAQALGVDSSKISVEASTIPPYDNTLPDGRFYSRTVIIEVRNPIVNGDAG